MRHYLKNHRGLAVTFVVLLAGLALGLVVAMHNEPSPQIAAGPPSCLGFTLDDPCITPQALAQCRAAVAQCGDGLVQVIQTCPLQFACGQ